MSTLRDLTDNYGGRLSGSPAYNRAVDGAVAKFRSYGIQDVHTESFMLPDGWQRGTADGEIGLAGYAIPACGIVGLGAIHATGRSER